MYFFLNFSIVTFGNISKACCVGASLNGGVDCGSFKFLWVGVVQRRGPNIVQFESSFFFFFWCDFTISSPHVSLLLLLLLFSFQMFINFETTIYSNVINLSM
jgi:hypothetical protein